MKIGIMCRELEARYGRLGFLREYGFDGVDYTLNGATDTPNGMISPDGKFRLLSRHRRSGTRARFRSN